MHLILMLLIFYTLRTEILRNCGPLLRARKDQCTITSLQHNEGSATNQNCLQDL